MDEEHLNKAEGSEGTKRVSSYIYHPINLQEIDFRFVILLYIIKL